MYFNILKKDLKRKKTMNIILLIFIILAVMFVSSGVNNLSAVTKALDTYFDMAGMTDYLVFTKNVDSGVKTTESIVKSLDCVKSYSTENCIYVDQSNIKKGKKNIKFSDIGIISSFETSKINFFDRNNNKVEKVNSGEIYVRKALMDENNISVGDKLTITIGSKSKSFTVKESIKDAMFGSAMIGTPRLLIAQSDYDEFAADQEAKNYFGKIIYINSDNTTKVENSLTDCSDVIFMGSRSLMKMTYMMDILNAAVLMIVSVCFILIAFVILRFTITFTLSEEYREIGIMKAIGIKNRKIRGLYMVKYFVLSVIGAVIGFCCGIPFGNMFLKQASEKIVIVSGSGYILNLICSIIVIGIIMLFCYRCTGKVKKFTPVDAIRNGSNGERYKKKGILRLSKTKSRPVLFMAVNDILSGIKRFSIMMITFTIGILLITIMANTMNTLKSDKMLPLFSFSQSDLFITDVDGSQQYIGSNGHEKLQNKLNKIESELKDKGIGAKCFCESVFRFKISKDDLSYKTIVFQGTGTTADMYEYMEGTPPQNSNEVAITYTTADKIKAKIGDTVSIEITNGNKKNYIVTAIYQSMCNTDGQGIRLSENDNINYQYSIGIYAYQIKYTDNPSESEKQSRFETIKNLYKDDTVRSGGEYIDYMIGGVSEYMNGTKMMIIIVVLLMNILVVVLMEKSFLTKEKSEIALLKAIGLKNNSIILWQTLRIAIVVLMSVIFAILLSEPLGQLSAGGIFKMMGAKNITFDINIFESYVLYPIAVFIVTVFAAFLTTQGVRKVSSSEINNIE